MIIYGKNLLTMENIKDINNTHITANLEIRKCRLSYIKKSKRLKDSSKPIQLQIEKEKEAEMRKPMKEFMKGNRCRICKSNSHLKRDVLNWNIAVTRKKGI